MAELVDAPDLESGVSACGFESLRSHHFMIDKNYIGLLMSLYSLGGSTQFTVGQGDSLDRILHDACKDGMVTKNRIFPRENSYVKNFKLHLTPKGKALAYQAHFIHNL